MAAEAAAVVKEDGRSGSGRSNNGRGVLEAAAVELMVEW